MIVEHISAEDKKALKKLIKNYDIKSIFEIGTWEGATALFLMNQTNITKVKTIDIHRNMNVDYSHALHPLGGKDFYGKHIKDTNIIFEFCDSMKYIPTKIEQYDMVFIDGNHDYAHIKNDTELAFKLKPKIIVWHDYGSPGNDDVLLFITELQKQKRKIRIFNNCCIAYLETKNEN